MKLSILIPAYNEEKTVEEVLKRVHALNLNGVKKEIIVVDDGSTDSTRLKIINQKSKIKDLKIITHVKNMGKGAAVQSGIKEATGDAILIQDADLEYNPNDIPTLLNALNNGNRVVYGTRLKLKPVFTGKRKTPFLLHYFGNQFLSLVTSLMYGSYVSDMETGYKMFRREVIDGINLKAKSFDLEPEITAKILKKGINIHEVDIKTKPRTYEEGKKINTFKDGFIALWTLIKYRLVD